MCTSPAAEAPLVHQLRFHKLPQALLQGHLVQGGHRLEQVIGEGTSERRAQLRYGFTGPGDPAAPSANRAG